MTRVKSQSAKRHRKIRKATKGYKHARSRRYGAGKEAALHAGQYAYHGRKLRKRNLRSLWIKRLNAAVRENEMSYSQFIAGLKRANIELDRKILSDIAVSDPETFKEILNEIK
jgi:large subunit ribosomal protein L20